MAQSYTTSYGLVLIDPGTYVDLSVLQGVSNIAAAGVVTIIGESSQGPGFMDEPTLSNVVYGPTQYNAVLAKYGSGPIVDGFAELINAANDPNILGSVTQVRIIKSNQSQPAIGTLSMREEGLPATPNVGPVYANGTALSQGAQGNLIQYQSEIYTPEVAPETGLFVYAPTLTGAPVINFSIRINGGPASLITVSPNMTPPTLVAALTSVTAGIMASGGNESLIVPVASTAIAAAPTATPGQLIVTLTSPAVWTVAPVVGDLAIIPLNATYGASQNSAIAGTAQANVGTYIVTGFTNSATSATVVLQAVNTTGTLVAASGSTHTDQTDLILFSQINIQNVTGSSRNFTLGVFGSYNVTLNTTPNIQITAPAGKFFNAIPQAGDILTVPANITLSGGTLNAGFYQVTAGTSTTVNATLISEGSSGSGTGTYAYASGPEIVSILQPILQGAGKTLSFEGTTSAIFLNASGQDEGLSNSQLISASEEVMQLTIIQGQNYSKDYQGGGNVILEVGYEGNNATVVVGPNSVIGMIGMNVAWTCTYVQFTIMSNLVAYINSQTGWSAALGSSKYSSINPNTLDEGTYQCSSTLPDVENARIKNDASAWATAVNVDTLVNWVVALQGLPDPTPNAQFLSGGSVGGTTSALIAAAIQASQNLTTNFVLTLFSQDASLDIPLGLTDSSSTYTIDAVNDLLSSSVLLMSQIEMRANRQAFGSYLGTFEAIQEAAGELANYRFALAMQPVMGVNSAGVPTMFQPWMSSIVAAGMQAAAGYKGIVKKFANINGLGTVSGFDPTDFSDRIQALQTGLLFMQPVATGGFRWVSDQTTYSVDNNFVYNSVQAIYISDLITLSLIDTFDRQVDGQSVADISAQAALSILGASMFNFMRLKWIAASSDAPAGYKNASANLIGPAMVMQAEIKLAGLIYFVPISLLVSQVTQTATQQTT